MTVEILREQEVFQDAIRVLIEHLEPAKATRVWASWQVGEGDYLSIRNQLFVNETVASLYAKVQTYQGEKEKQAE
jgi:hypothetical protein